MLVEFIGVNRVNGVDYAEGSTAELGDDDAEFLISCGGAKRCGPVSEDSPTVPEGDNATALPLPFLSNKSKRPKR